MDSAALHQLHSPSGITKTNRQGRRPGKTACRACHARKKRCDIAPPYRQCTHCRKENQFCIPRNPIERSTRQRMNDRNHNRNTSQTTIHTNENTNCQFKKSRLSPPAVIHHEIPRWSVLYSFYSEVSRLLPCSFSTSPCPSSEAAEDIADTEDASNGRKDESTTSGNEECTGVACMRGFDISTPRSRCSSPALPDKTLDLQRTLAAREAIIWHEDRSSMGPNESGRDSAFSSDGFMNDLDALLRF